MVEELVRLAVDVAPEDFSRKDFEVVAIRPGLANGLVYGPDVLERAARLFNGVTVFCNHPDALDLSRAGGRRVEDIAGVVVASFWDGKCVRAKLSTGGPKGRLVADLAARIVCDREAGLPVPNVGLSADMMVVVDRDPSHGLSPGRRGAGRVAEIVRVLSLDVVFNPAAGGEFERVLNGALAQIASPSAGHDTASGDSGAVEQKRGAQSWGEQEQRGGRKRMEERVTYAANGGEVASPSAGHDGVAVSADVRAMLAEIQQATNQAKKLAEEQVKAACANLLDARLQACKLPAAMKEEVREQFAGRAFTAEELDGVIGRKEAVFAKLVEGSVIRGMGYQGPVVVGMRDSLDRVQAAADRLFGLDLPDNLKDTPRLSGIRELYVMLTGDYDFHGRYYGDRVQLASATSATMTSVVANALHKAMLQAFEMRPQWWKPIAYEEDFTKVQDVKWLTVGGFGDLPTVSEGAAYEELTWADRTETASFVKKGGFIGLTLEMIDKDDVGAVRTIPRKIGLAAWRTLSSLVGAIFTANSGVGPTLSDSLALFHSSHGNLGSTALALDSWDACVQAMFKQTELGSGKRLGIRPAYCLVPIELEKTARTIFGSPQVPGSPNNDINVRTMPADRVITVPEFTDANDWAAAADPADLPGVCIGYRFGRAPEVFVADDPLTGSMFTNDEMRIKARFVVAVGVGDYRALYKANVS